MSSQIFTTYRACAWRCRSQQHSNEQACAITKSPSAVTDDQLKIYLALTCTNFGRSKDSGGRTLVHWAASAGDRTDLLEWLLDDISAEIDSKDLESGYTPLHRALLHGQLATAQMLLDHGASLHVFDHEGFTPLDIVRQDQEAGLFSLTGPTEVYSCGENVTSNLGHRVPTERVTPDLVDYFSHRSLSVRKVAMSKWHTVFLTSDGVVYSCGRGSLGRLGHGDLNDRTVPTRVHFTNDICVSIAVGEDHTVVVTERGLAFGWGSNGHSQLGAAAVVASVLSPQLISLGKNIKDQTFLGCACGGQYTILWTKEYIFGCGANEGQFGPCALQKEPIVFPLRQITGVSSPFVGTDLLDVACGDFAVAILTKAKHDVFLLQNHECRRIFGRDLNFIRVLMNSSVPRKTEHVNQPGQDHQHGIVRLIAFTETGAVYSWDTKDRALRRCLFSGGAQKMIYPCAGCAFGMDGLFLVTSTGQLYKGRIREFDADKRSSAKISVTTKPTVAAGGDGPGGAWVEKSYRKQSSAVAARPTTNKESSPYFAYRVTGTFLDRSECQLVTLSAPIPNVHRAIAVASASDGRNFCIIQQSPKAGLTELPPAIDSTVNEEYRMLLAEADVDDYLHDVQIRTSENGAQFRAAHRFILCSRCPYFSKRMRPSTTQLQIEEPVFIVNESTLERIMTYIYTDDCDLLNSGPVLPHGAVVDNSGEQTAGKPIRVKDPVRELKEAAKRLNLKVLAKRLEAVRWEAATNTIRVQHRYGQRPQPVQYEPSAFPELCDVVLQCKDGVCLSAHRCILAARSEYFRCMFATGWWSETRRHQTLTVDVESAVLMPVIHYLYKDELPTQPTLARKSSAEEKETDAVTNNEYAMADKDALDYYGHILVCADQWLLDRLRRLCEMELAARITLRNVADLMEFSHTVNSAKLFDSCSQFISLNLCSLFEANAFRFSTPDCLRRVGAYYRDWYPHVGHRAITPSSAPPTVDAILDVWNEVLASGVSPNDILHEFASWAQLQGSADSPTALGVAGKKKRGATRLTPRARRTSASAETAVSSADSTAEVPPDVVDKYDAGHNRPFAKIVPLKEANLITPSDQKEFRKWESSQITVEMQPVLARSVAKTVETSKPVAVPIARNTPLRSRNRPWHVTVSPIENMPEVSLRDLMAAEQKKEVAAVAERRKSSEINVTRLATSPKSPAAWTSTSPPSFVASLRGNAQSSLQPDAPAAVAKAGTKNRAFEEIVNEEKSKETERTRILNKPLKFVQDEEVAMQELALLYQIEDNWDELITIERASSVVAEPTWRAHLGSPPRS